jgi:alcohol dehydrogenase (cytochrome c)
MKSIARPVFRPRSRSARTAAAAAITVLIAAASGCGGGGDESAPPTTTATTTTETTTTTTEPGGGAVDGAQVFADNCESCHGVEGAGGHVGPNLQTSSVAEDRDQVEQQVRNGGGVMPAFEGTLSDEQIDAVVTYVADVIAPQG